MNISVMFVCPAQRPATESLAKLDKKDKNVIKNEMKRHIKKTKKTTLARRPEQSRFGNDSESD